MNILEFKLCDIQGRLFELFLNTEYDPEMAIDDLKEIYKQKKN